MFSSVLWRARMGIDRGHCVHRQRGGRLRWDRRRRLRPAMSGEDSVDVFPARKFDGIRVLCNIKSVEVLDKAEILEWGCIFRWQLQGFANLSV
jgi:hypothetical protein